MAILSEAQPKPTTAILRSGAGQKVKVSGRQLVLAVQAVAELQATIDPIGPPAMIADTTERRGLSRVRVPRTIRGRRHAARAAPIESLAPPATGLPMLRRCPDRGLPATRPQPLPE